MKKHLYFDHSASTPVNKAVLKSMLPYFTELYGNPSSIHTVGQEAMKGVDDAKNSISQYFKCKPDELIFTSGATEANNLAIIGIIKALEKKWPGQKFHTITSVIEHDSVLEPFGAIQKMGHEVSHISVDHRGVVKLNELKAAIKDNTVFISIMQVNSEVGSIQPIREIGKIVKKANEARLKIWQKDRSNARGEKPQPIIFHTDATQGINFLPLNVNDLNLDTFSMSAHKIYGPKGVGLLYVRQGTPIIAQIVGGHHQNNRRSGTLNTAGIVGLAEAIKQISPEVQEKTNKEIAVVRDYLIEGLIKKIPNIVLNTAREISTPAHAHFSFIGVEGESILIALDLEGIAVSTGSACASNSLKASHVIVAMGIKVEVAHSSIRFSLGKMNTTKDVDVLLKKLPPIIKRLRSFNPLYNKK